MITSRSFVPATHVALPLALPAWPHATDTICFYPQNIVSAPQLGKSNDELGRRLDDSIEGNPIGRRRRALLELMLAHLATLKTMRKLFNSVPSMELRLAILQRQDGNKVAMEIAQLSVTRLGPSAGFRSIDRNSWTAPQTGMLIEEEAMRNGSAAVQICDSFCFAIAATAVAIQSSGNERFD